MAEVILPLLYETYAGKTNWKFYGFMWPDPAARRANAISKEIRNLCSGCPLRYDCLPEQKRGLGGSLMFIARMTYEPECKIPKAEKGSLRIGISLE